MLLVAPCYRGPSQGPTPGAVFTSEMICEATIDRIVELLKLTNSGMLSLLFIVVTTCKISLCSIPLWSMVGKKNYSDQNYFFLLNTNCLKDLS